MSKHKHLTTDCEMCDGLTFDLGEALGHFIEAHAELVVEGEKHDTMEAEMLKTDPDAFLDMSDSYVSALDKRIVATEKLLDLLTDILDIRLLEKKRLSKQRTVGFNPKLL